MNRCIERLHNGIVKENPTFVLMLGMCPTLAVTTSLINGAGMGLSTTVVLVMSNVMIALLRKVIPNGVRVPAFIVIVASFVTLLQFMLEAYLPSLNSSLGIYIPLIVVNCIILGRAESYASKNPVLPSLFDGLGMGLGFTVGLSCLGAVRELIGAGSVAGIQILGEGSITGFSIFESYQPITIFILAPGAFFVLAFLVALQNKMKLNAGKKTKEKGCLSGDCANCSVCGDNTKTDREEA
ncbi:MAG: electron transport complex subunit RsxE [Eubacterium sp.]